MVRVVGPAFVLLTVAVTAPAQTLYNNAVIGGLVDEGLRTRPRPGGGD